MKRLKRSNVVMCVVMLLLCAALCLLPPVLETIGERRFDRLRQTASGEALPF